MPSESKHLESYRKNKKLLETEPFRSNSHYADWYIVVAFYSALHLVESVLVQTDSSRRTHTKRALYISRHTKLKDISYQYAALSIQSRRARYDCVTFTAKDKADMRNLLDEIENKILAA